MGRWNEPGATETTEFHADGSVTEKLAGGETIRGRYLFDGAKLKINLDGVPDELSFSAVVKNDGLEMTDAEGQVTRYRRV